MKAFARAGRRRPSQACVTAAPRTRYIDKNTEVPMRFDPIGNEFAAVVEGIDLCAPLNSAQVATIHAGMDRYAVLVFNDQPLTDEQTLMVTFAANSFAWRQG